MWALGAQVTIVESVKLEFEHVNGARKPCLGQHGKRLLAPPHHAKPGPAILQPLGQAVQERHLTQRRERENMKQKYNNVQKANERRRQ